ncbi:hypothetical protein NPIL_696051 [Nephila pilipes]|uniref:Pre-C2HC domain-containing protein n=1 Tax=Nephila pilipes TaxID=299642 RepID=A0A8X6NXY4_NEPPI|nr:hypothetical protein NPIL_696051 [Nephila pilipes]
MLKINNYKNQLKAINQIIPDLRTRLSGEYIKLYVDTPEEYRKLIDFLSSRQEFEYYVIRPVQLRPIKAIIKGLPRETTPQEINEELIEYGFSPIRVVQLTNRRTKIPLPVY